MKKAVILLLLMFALLLVSCGSPYVEGAKVYIQQEDWSRALEQLKIEIDTNPINGEAYFLMGQVYAEMDSLEKMAVAFDKALELKPELEPEIWKWRESNWVKAFNRGVNAGKRKTPDYDAALKWTKTAVFIDSTRADGWKNLGYFYSMKDMDEESKKAYIKAFSLDDTDLKNGMVVVNLYLNNEEYDEALEVLDKLEVAHPEDTDILVQKGVIYINQEEWEKAIEVLEKAKGIDATDRAILFNLGMTYYRQEKYNKATDNFKGVVDLLEGDPDELHMDALLGYGGALYAQEKYAEAEPVFRELIKIDQNHSSAWEHLGTTLAKLDKTKEGNVAYNHGRGLYFMEIEGYESAVKYFKDAVAINPDHLLSWEKLKEVYEKLGDDVKAQETAKKIEELQGK